MSEEIGFIGLGNMGLEMAANPIAAGHRLAATVARPRRRSRWLQKARATPRAPAM